MTRRTAVAAGGHVSTQLVAQRTPQNQIKNLASRGTQALAPVRVPFLRQYSDLISHLVCGDFRCSSPAVLWAAREQLRPRASKYTKPVTSLCCSVVQAAQSVVLGSPVLRKAVPTRKFGYGRCQYVSSHPAASTMATSHGNGVASCFVVDFGNDAPLLLTL